MSFHTFRFVVHRHSDKSPYWDLRLECKHRLWTAMLDKEPSNKVNDPQLAVRMKDVTIDFLKFEGTIKYGEEKGELTIWDKGNYTLLKESPTEVFFRMNGDKLKGVFSLIEINNKKHNLKRISELKDSLRELKNKIMIERSNKKKSGCLNLFLLEAVKMYKEMKYLNNIERKNIWAFQKLKN